MPLDSSLNELSEAVSKNDVLMEKYEPGGKAIDTVFEDTNLKWERLGTDGHALDFVEKAAAEFTGRVMKFKMPTAAENVDQSITEAMVPSLSTPDMVGPLLSSSASTALRLIFFSKLNS